jgi:hypothetical protein
LLGYSEGIDSERGITWRLADSLSTRKFISYALTEETPEFGFDAVFYHALRETGKPTAMELGQWIEMRQKVTPPAPPMAAHLPNSYRPSSVRSCEKVGPRPTSGSYCPSWSGR